MTMRIRLTYAKTASLRYTGTLDMQRSWERTIRRAHLPIAYSQGFRPQARINQASALPLGFTSRAEMLDLWLDAPLPLPQVHDALTGALPPGVDLLDLRQVDLQAPSVQNVTISADYVVRFRDPAPAIEALTDHVKRILSAERLPRQRREKTYDLRVLIEALEAISDGNGASLRMRLASRPSATGRPDEVLAEMGFPVAAARIERTRLILAE